jgi:hypothetical protein
MEYMEYVCTYVDRHAHTAPVAAPVSSQFWDSYALYVSLCMHHCGNASLLLYSSYQPVAGLN